MNFRLKDGRATAWQWDQDVVLILDGVADGTEIHLGYSATSVLKKTVENGELVVPNILLTRNRDIPIFIYDGENTTDSALLEVVGRPKPPDYIYTEPEKLTWELLEERIDGLSASLDKQREFIETVGNNSLPFVISVTGENEAYIANKTYEDTMAAYNAGRRIVCVLNAEVPVDNGETYHAEGAQIPLHTVLDDGTLIFQHGTVNPYGMSLEVTFMPEDLISAVCYVVSDGAGSGGGSGGVDIDLSDYAKLSDIEGVAYLDADDNTSVEVPEDGGSGGSCTCEAPSIGENGNWYIGETDTGICAVGTPTDTQVNSAVRDYLTENPVSGGEWILLGEATVGSSIEFFPTSVENGIVTIDPTSDNYDMLSSTGKINAVLVRKDLAYRTIDGSGIVNCLLEASDYDAGTFNLLNGDWNAITTAYSAADYKIVLKTVLSCSVSGVTSYTKYRFRCITPYMCAHGVRNKFNSTMGIFCWPGDSNSYTGGVIYEVETFPYMDGSEYVYVKRTISVAGTYSLSNNIHNNIYSPLTNVVLRPASEAVAPSDGIVTFSCATGVFAPGMIFQIWGCN